MDPNKYLKADFLDILFEGRNKEYGAYELRKNYDRRVRNSTILTILVSALFIGGFAATRMLNNNNAKEKPKAADVKLENLKLPDPNQPPPPPPPPPAPEPPKVKPQVQFTPPKVVKDEQVKPDEQP